MKKFTDILEGLGRGREDDEYHTPDPTTRTHKVAFNVSKDGGEKHNRTVTISNSTKSKEEAHKTARAHLEKQGYKIHESVDEKCPTCGKNPCWCDDSHGFVNESTDHHAKAEENKRSADAAKSQARPFDYHMHMADHHDNMSQWHASKGRHGEADKHAQKSDEHHEKAMTVKESVELDESAKGHTIEAHGIKGTKGTPWRKTFKSHDHLNDWADKNDSVEVHGTRDLEHAKKTNEEVKLDEVRMTAAMKLQKAFEREQEKTARERKAGEDLTNKNKEKPVQEGLKPEHKMRPGWMLKADPKLAKKVADNKKKYKEFKSLVGTKKD